MKQYAQRHSAVDLAEARLKQHARRYLPGFRVRLFGSRARGDAMRRSDFDLAVEPRSNEEAGSLPAFEDAVRNDPEIIYPVDVVDMRDVPEVLRHKIHQEGVLWTN